MHIVVNGEERTFEGVTNVEELLAELGEVVVDPALGSEVARRRGRHAQVGDRGVGRALAGQGRLAGEDLEEHGTEAVEVALRSRSEAAQLFGRHVSRRPEDLPGRS